MDMRQTETLVEDDTFGDISESLSLAAQEALSERDRLIFDLRLGLSDGEWKTLRQVGTTMGLSGERIRQIMARCVRRIRARAAAQRRRHDIEGACLTLVTLVQEAVQPDDAEIFERLVRYTLPLPYAHAWVVWRLLRPKDDVRRLREMDQQRRNYLAAEARRTRAAGGIERLVAGVAWPRTTRTISAMPSIRRAREVSQDSEGHAGSFVSEKMGRDVTFESGLELKVLQYLENSPLVAAYQEQPFSITYHDDDRLRQYFPDVFVLLKDGRGIVVEVKPLGHFALHANFAKWAALRSFCEREGYGVLITDGRTSVTALMHHPVLPRYREAMHGALQAGPLSWPAYRRLRNEYRPSVRDFVAFVLQFRVEWRLLPFSLRLPASERSQSRALTLHLPS